ncbi:hypothetical protein N9R86_00280 [Alphaproteobacteria bacterium]|nr:hypothetical protein [Alphaproteobacteria bacterium]
MKYFLCIIFFLTHNNIIAESMYKFEFNGNFTENTVLLSDKSSFSSLKSFGAFSDNQGNIGKYQCNGVREASSNGKLIDINVLCEVTDKGLDKIWMKAKRVTDKSGGVGNYHIIDTTGKFKNLKGKICAYAVTFFNEIIFVKAGCK